MPIDYSTGEVTHDPAQRLKRPNVGTYTSITHDAAREYCLSDEITGGDAKIILGLSWLVQRNGELPYSTRVMAEKMGRNHSGVHRAINKFVRLGLLLKLPGRAGYTLNPYKMWNYDVPTHVKLAREADRYHMDAVMGVNDK